ncbi:MAG TPA: cysteine--tRNA ligase [Caulobacterales bacterium]|jgi:cysteinyl-tRNA synthetase|nr:cysteine--tRNA ligase [Caulobacterales bacterium]
MPELHLFNTLTRRKAAFAPADPGRVTMYVCGPTVYNYAHVGNAVGPVAFDVLFRLLRHLYGPDHVVYARNFTDIDDKIIAAAADAGEPIEAVTSRYTQAYRDQMSALGVLTPTIEPTATSHIDAMIAMISRLIEKGAAYHGTHGVWFSVEADPDYGRLSGRDLDDQLAGARVEGEADKRDPADFALWKAAKEGEPFWESPFGPGRPGWHIECSAMIAKKLGDTIDIHGGGQDLIFPHHENEIAQSETACGHPLARVWLHNGMLTMNAEKMSKSLGNIVTLRELLEQWPGEVVRYALLSAHYRTPPNWSDELLAQAKASLDRLYGALERVQNVFAPPAHPPEAVVDAVCDDLNTPKAMAELFALASALNKAESKAEKARLKGDLLAAGALLGVLQADPAAWFKQRGEGDISDADVDALVAARISARAAKNFAEADRIRAELDSKGVIVMDSPQGSTWRRAG